MMILYVKPKAAATCAAQDWGPPNILSPLAIIPPLENHILVLKLKSLSFQANPPA